MKGSMVGIGILQIFYFVCVGCTWLTLYLPLLVYMVDIGIL